MIWGLLACTSPQQVATPSGDTALPYSPNTAQLSGTEAAALAQAALDLGLPTAAPIAEQWVSLVDTYADPDCPDRVDYAMLDAPFGCRAASDAYFSGMTALTQSGDRVELLCDAYVLTPEGERFECGGEAIQLQAPDGASVWTFLIGTFGWQDRPTEEGGLFSAALRIQSEPGGRLTLNGGVSTAAHALNFDALVWQGQVASGSLAVYTAHGWYRSTLGPQGCGAWLFEDGQAQGQGCVDLSPALNAWLGQVSP